MKRKEIEINLIKDKNVNQFYDPARMNNGGGYYQPCKKYEIILPSGKKLYFEYNDTSCGDFGARIFIGLYDTDKMPILTKYYDTVNRIPNVSFEYNGEYQNVIKYLYNKGYLNDWDLTPEWVNIGAWETVYWGVNKRLENLIQKIINY